MNRQFKIYNLFPTPVFENQIDLSKYNIDLLLNKEFEYMENKSAKITKDKNVLETVGLEQLKKELLFNLELYTKNFLKVYDKKIKWYLQKSWVNKHETGDWGQPHYHANSLISGVLYLETNDETGEISFECPTNYRPIFPLSCNLEFTERTIENSTTYFLKPKNGLLILFPSSLLHAIKENKSETNRYSLAFNFHIEGELMNENDLDYLRIRR